MLAEGVDGEHVGMREARHRARLLREEVVHVREAHHRRLDELDGDATLQSLVQRSRDDAHAADTEHALDAIGPTDQRPERDADVRERIARSAQRRRFSSYRPVRRSLRADGDALVRRTLRAHVETLPRVTVPPMRTAMTTVALAPSTTLLLGDANGCGAPKVAKLAFRSTK